MAIGKPLLVTERKSVANPVLSAQTQALSSNVPVQKIAMADYSIGMNNALASQAVSGELVGMVSAGVNAAVLLDKTAKEHKTLDLMSDWDTQNQQYKQAFAEAITLADKQEVTKNYNQSVGNLTSQWGETVPPTTENKVRFSRLKKTAGDQYSTFHSSTSLLLHKQTISKIDTQIATLEQDMSENLVNDIPSKQKELAALYLKKVDLGGITPDGAVFDLQKLNRGVLDKRVSLAASAYTDGLVQSGDIPSEEGMLASMGHIQMEIPDHLRTQITQDYEDQYIKRISVANTKEIAERKFVTNQYREQVDSLTFEMTDQIAKGHVSIEQYDAYRSVIAELPTELQATADALTHKLEGWFSGAADQLQVAQYTDDTTMAGHRRDSDLYNNGLWNIANVEKMLDGFDTNAATVIAMRQKFSAENTKNITKRSSYIPNLVNTSVSDIFASGEGTPDGIMVNSLIANNANFQQDFLNLSTKGTGPRKALTPELLAVIASVETQLKTEAESGTGRFNKEIMEKTPYDEWYKSLATDVKMRVRNGLMSSAIDQEKAATGQRVILKQENAAQAKVLKKANEEMRAKQAENALEVQKEIEAAEEKKAASETPEALAEQLSVLKEQENTGLSDMIETLRLQNLVDKANGVITLGSEETPIWDGQTWATIVDAVGDDLRTLGSVFDPLDPAIDYATEVKNVAIKGAIQAKQAIADTVNESLHNAAAKMKTNMINSPALKSLPSSLLNSDKVKRSLELSKQAGWPARGSKELAAVDRQLEAEFPNSPVRQPKSTTPESDMMPMDTPPIPPLDTLIESVVPAVEQVLGKGLWEPTSDEQRQQELSQYATEPIDGTITLEKNAPAGEEVTLMMSDFLAQNYNASSPEQQAEYSARSKERLEAYYTERLSPKEKSNLDGMISVLDKAKSSFIDDLTYLKMPYDEFLDYMISIYGAETNFGTTKKVSKTGVVGELQVTRESFGDVVKPEGNLGPQMAAAAGFSIEKLRTLALPKNDAKLRKLLLNNKKLNFLAGAAILLSKLQYN